MAGVAKKSPQAHQNRAGTDGSAVGPLGLAFKSCLLCPESDRAVDARAEIHVNSSRHAARVAPEILQANRDAPAHCGYNASRLTGNDRIHEEFLQLLAQRKPRTQGGRPLY